MTNKETIKKEIESDIKKYMTLDSINTTEAGKLFKEQLRKEISGLVTVLSKYKEEHIKLISLISEIEVRVEMLRAIKNSKQNLEGAKEVLSEALEDLTTSD